MTRARFFLHLLGGSALILISVFGFVLLDSMPWLSNPILSVIETGLAATDTEVYLDGISLEQKIDLEFLLCRRVSRKQTGETVQLEISGPGKKMQNRVRLISYFDHMPFSLIHLLVLLLSSLIAFLVLALKREDPRARLMFWAILTFAAAEVITGGFHCLAAGWTSYIPGVLFYICYALAPCLFLRFSFVFSAESHRIRNIWVFYPALIFMGILIALFMYSSLAVSLSTYRVYQSVFYFFRWYVLLYALAAAFVFISTYRKTQNAELRARIKWILYGFFLGLGPFLLLYQFPKILTSKELISMEAAMAFSVFLPACAGIAIIRHRLLDIEVVINRSLVYSLLSIFVVGVYLFLARLFQNMFSHMLSISDTFGSTLAALGAALVFHPARKKIQLFVDRSFFRAAYDYRKAIQEFTARAVREVDPRALLDSLEKHILEVLPIQSFGAMIWLLEGEKRNEFLIKGPRKSLQGVIPLLRSEKMPLGKTKVVFTQEGIDFSQDGPLQVLGWDLVLPISFLSYSMQGFLACGSKKSGERFNPDDVGLLLTLSQELGANLERIRLQEEVVYERAEREKLDELNQLKTEFISSVSHELRTPMTTLRNLADLLHEGKIKDKEKRSDLLQLMSDECTRLSQFLHNILDSGRIERNALRYTLEKADLKVVVLETARLFEHRLKKQGFDFSLELPEQPIVLSIDQAAVKQALTNLLDNAIKYSLDRQEIKISLQIRKKSVTLAVLDRGIGINTQEKEQIYQGFFRGEAASRICPGGVGIGLKIVKHIMDAHEGRVSCSSDPSQGTEFILDFPKL